MEDQRQKLYTTEINLAIEKQTVLDLKAELQKVKEAAQVAKEAAEAAINASYEHGVLDMETCLAEEVAIVYRDYIMKSWGIAMDRAEVPTDSKLRRAKSIFFPVDIQEIPDMVSSTEQLLPTQTSLVDAKVPKGA